MRGKRELKPWRRSRSRLFGSDCHHTAQGQTEPVQRVPVYDPVSLQRPLLPSSKREEEEEWRWVDVVVNYPSSRLRPSTLSSPPDDGNQRGNRVTEPPSQRSPKSGGILGAQPTQNRDSRPDPFLAAGRRSFPAMVFSIAAPTALPPLRDAQRASTGESFPS